jgi:hypothetical protein
MKCIKVIKAAKSYELGDIRRVDNAEADVKVSTGYWAFCPKSEWKAATRKPKNDQATDQATDQVERVKSKKQLKKQKAEA